MTPADERLRRILSQRDAPAEDAAFVNAVMAEAARTAPARPQGLPALLRPFAWIACLVALGAVAPLLAQGVKAALEASDAQVLSGSLALALTAWFVMNAFARSFRPIFAG
jgi:hypothetical protein